MLSEEQRTALAKVYKILMRLPAPETKEYVSDDVAIIECAEAEVEYQIEEEVEIPAIDESL